MLNAPSMPPKVVLIPSIRSKSQNEVLDGTSAIDARVLIPSIRSKSQNSAPLREYVAVYGGDVLIPSIRSKSQNAGTEILFSSFYKVLIPSIRSKSQNLLAEEQRAFGDYLS